MAREPQAPVDPLVAPPPDVVVDYELALTTAREFVRHYKAAQHLEQLAILLTQREQLLQELDRRRVLALAQLQQIEEQTATLQAVYEAEQAKMTRLTREATRRDQQWKSRAEEIAEATAVAESQLASAQAAHEARLKAQAVAADADQAAHVADTQRLLDERSQQLREVEARHLAQLEQLQARAQEEGQRADAFKAEIAAMRERLMGATTLEEVAP